MFYLGLLSVMTMILLPIYYIFLTAFAQGDRIFTKPLSYVPQRLNLEKDARRCERRACVA